MLRFLPALLALGGVACTPAGTAFTGSDSDGLVFARPTGATNDLFWVRIADGAERVLRATPDEDEVWPYWSSGAGRVAFQARSLGRARGYQLRLLDPGSGREAPLLAKPAHNEHWAVWAPDGARLAYAFAERDRTPPSGLAVVELASGKRSILASAGRWNGFYRPEYAPDSRRIVAQRRGAGDAESRLWILEPGLAPRPLVAVSDGFEEKGRFTRDGAFVVYTRRASRRRPGDIARIRPDGSGAALIASAPGADDHTARPSPTRDEIAFISDRDGSQDLFLADLAGGAPRNLTRTPDLEERAPRWSPDGELVVVTLLPARGEEDGAHRVRVIDREGGVRLDVVGKMPDFAPAWE